MKRPVKLWYPKHPAESLILDGYGLRAFEKPGTPVTVLMFIEGNRYKGSMGFRILEIDGVPHYGDVITSCSSCESPGFRVLDNMICGGVCPEADPWIR